MPSSNYTHAIVATDIRDPCDDGFGLRLDETAPSTIKFATGNNNIPLPPWASGSGHGPSKEGIGSAPGTSEMASLTLATIFAPRVLPSFSKLAPLIVRSNFIFRETHFHFLSRTIRRVQVLRVFSPARVDLVIDNGEAGGPATHAIGMRYPELLAPVVYDVLDRSAAMGMPYSSSSLGTMSA